MSRKKTFVVTANRLDALGFGVGESLGVTFHVKNLLPGETALVEVEHKSPHSKTSWAKIRELQSSPSAFRQTPICPAFGECGGCAWQHLRYEAQLKEKEWHLRDSLKAHSPLPAFSVAASATEEYRNRGKYVIGRHKGKIVLGAYRPRTHEIVDTLGCKVVEPCISKSAISIREAIEDSSLAVYDEIKRQGDLRYVVIRSGFNGKTLVTYVTSGETQRDSRRKQLLVELAHRTMEIPSIMGVLWSPHDRPSGVILGDELLLLAGKPLIEETVGDFSIPIGPTDFVQMNRDQATRMYDEICRAVARIYPIEENTQVLDLYCGVGAIGLNLCRENGILTGVEINPHAIEKAIKAASLLGERASFHCNNAQKYFEQSQADSANVVIVNPPRKGLDRALRDLLRQSPPDLFIYVSCNPQSLNQDLIEIGWGEIMDLVHIQAFDLMPGTAHLETLVIFRKLDH